MNNVRDTNTAHICFYIPTDMIHKIINFIIRMCLKDYYISYNDKSLYLSIIKKLTFHHLVSWNTKFEIIVDVPSIIFVIVIPINKTKKYRIVDSSKKND